MPGGKFKFQFHEKCRLNDFTELQEFLPTPLTPLLTSSNFDGTYHFNSSFLHSRKNNMEDRVFETSYSSVAFNTSGSGSVEFGR